MKKLLGLVLILVLLVSASAYAEEFTLHSGTKFGMSLDEVKKLEMQNGFSFSVSPYSDTTLQGMGIVANQSNTTIYYSFGKSGLSQMQYDFASHKGYDAVEEGLIAKYGKTDYSSETWKEFPQLYKMGSGATTPYTSYEYNMSSFTRKDYSHRIVETEDGLYVFIEHYTSESSNILSNKVNHSHVLTYRLVSEDYANEILNGASAISNDL